MAASQGVLIDLAGAILDGAHVDWASAESGVEASDRALLDPLRVVAALADVHRRRQEPSINARVTARLRVVPPRPPQREQWGHLRVLERIGRGAFGEVYRAWDTRLDREVALKVLQASAASTAPRATTIIEEGRLLARVRHPNVVTIYGAERIGGEVGLWMEFVKGVTLAQAIEQGKTFGTPEALAIGTELCSAVAAVHGAGLLHRDIKAQNVMLADEGRVVLMDFGTGRELGDGSPPGLAGTPLYLAPELLTGAEPTVRSDIYSVGVLLYHLFTSSFPLKAATFHELKQAHARRDRLALAKVRPDLPSKLTAVIERALDPQPERRQPNALALAGDLTAITRRPRLIPFAAALAIAAVVTLVTWSAIGTRDRQARGVSPAPGLATSGAGAAATAVERPVIAVLPLKNLSAEPDSDYFVDGLTDEIIRNLAVVKGLEVRSRTSSFAFKDKPRNLRDVGEQLGVNLVVEGSIMRSGSRLRINAQLVQVAGDVPVWAERFDRELKDVFAIQDEISRAIVNKLRLTLGGGQRRYDTNLEAYELYLKARVLVDRRSAFPAQQAIKLFEQAIARDPSFAPAYAGLADAYAAASEQIPGRFGPAAMVRPDTALELIRPAAETALQLDPLLAEAHAAMGLLSARKLDWQKAEESFRRAIDLNPSLTHIYVTYSMSTLVPLGKLAEAEQLLQRALQSDPLSLNVQRELAWQQLLTGRYEEAIDGFERIRAIDPDFPYVEIPLARALTFAGRPAEALRLLEPKKAGVGYQHWMAHAYVMVGRRAEVERLAATHDHPFRLAVIYAALGETDRAFAALDQAVVEVPHRVAVDLLREPEMAALRGDPRFDGIRRKLGLP
jgi:TolB-like protein/Tfp pilus assembly protein PilF